jgi:polyvinyl alcohol dehydrogenase (cytochrome)
VVLKRLLLLPLLFASVQLYADQCIRTEPGLQTLSPDSWGFDLANTRLQSRSGINKDNVSRLKLKWTYGFANQQPRVFPLVSEDTIFIGDAGYGVVALDRETGCERWSLPVTGQLGSSIAFYRDASQVTLFIAERNKGIIAIDARTGKQRWFSSPGDNPLPMYSGSPQVYGDMLLVPLSSAEIALPMNPFYGCCETSGGVASINIATGETNWYTRSIPELPKVTGRRWLFIETHGPSGAPVWGSPTIDEKRQRLYFGTGQNYSHPTSDTSDAIIALDINTGDWLWHRQFTANDAYNLACNTLGVNCPDPVGPDVDFGAPPIIATLPDGTDILLAGQKSGDVYAMNPDNGDVLWQRKVGRGGALGGVHWGMAVNNQLTTLFVPISDRSTGPLTGKGEPAPGLHALNSATGQVRWVLNSKPTCEDCWGGISTAISANDSLVFFGTMDGAFSAADAENGNLLWTEDTWNVTYSTVNDVPAKGGTFDGHGPMLIDDMVIVPSGYGSFGQNGGNVLLVYQLAEPSND